MSEDGSSGPRFSDAGRRARAERETRRGEALRANLRRRKAQARERSAADKLDDETPKSSGPGRQPSGGEPGQP